MFPEVEAVAKRIRDGCSDVIADVFLEVVARFLEMSEEVDRLRYRADEAETRVKELEEAQKPRPMSEAPTDGTWITVAIDVSWNGRFWEDTDGDDVNLDLADGWFPLPNPERRR